MARRMSRLACAVLAAWGLFSSPASAQGWGPKTQAALDKLTAEDRANVSAALSACRSLTDTHLELYRQRLAPGFQHPDHAALVDQNGEYWTGVFTQWSLQDMEAMRNTHDLSKRPAGLREPMESEAAASAQAFCLFGQRIAQLEGRSTTTAQSAPATIPKVSDLLKMPADDVQKLALDYGEGGYGPRAQAALRAVLAPGAPKAKQLAPALDYGAVKDGGPMTEQSRRDEAKAREAFDKAKTRKLHNRENDATDCLRVEPTGVRQEWGMEGKFRLMNTCGYPVEASWCANASECSTGRGNLWTIPANGKWPIFFADPSNPQIGVGACRTGANAKPLASDAAISAAGGINESHVQPTPAPGVHVAPNHRCE